MTVADVPFLLAAQPWEDPWGPADLGATTQGLLKLMTTLLTGPLLTATQLGQVPTNERSWHFHFPISHKFCYSIFENLPRAQLQ